MHLNKDLRFIGLDVHKKWVYFCTQTPKGQIALQDRFPATPDQIRGFARSLRPTDAVALEATTNTWAIVDLLEEHAGRVVVSNPLATKAIASAKIKTDKVDASVLAHLLRLDYLPDVWRPDERTRLWRQAVRFHDRFVRRRTQLKNQAHAVFHQNLLAFDGSDLFGPTGRRWIDHQRPRLSERDRFELDLLLDELDRTDERIAALDRDMAKMGYPVEDVRLLMTIPGVDFYAAISLLAAIGDVGRFPSARKLTSYFGLVSRVSQSGQHCYLGPITKRGRSHGRWIAIQSAQHLCRAQGPLRHFYQRIKKRKGHNVAVVAVARKLVTLAWHILTKREPFRYAVPRTTETKLARLRVLATGRKKKTGTQKGTARSKNYGTGRRVKFAKPLNQVLSENELPEIGALPPGEQKMLRREGLKVRAENNIYKGTPIVTRSRINSTLKTKNADREKQKQAG